MGVALRRTPDVSMLLTVTAASLLALPSRVSAARSERRALSLMNSVLQLPAMAAAS